MLNLSISDKFEYTILLIKSVVTPKFIIRLRELSEYLLYLLEAVKFSLLNLSNNANESKTIFTSVLGDLLVIIVFLPLLSTIFA